jgi:hypothetical protein
MRKELTVVNFNRFGLMIVENIIDTNRETNKTRYT